MNEGLIYLVALIVNLIVLIVEIHSAFDDEDGDTITEYLRRFLGIGKPLTWKRRFYRVLLIVGLTGFTAWFLPHILFPGLV